MEITVQLIDDNCLKINDFDYLKNQILDVYESKLFNNHYLFYKNKGVLDFIPKEKCRRVKEK